MSYIHNGTGPVEATRSPIDPDATDWFYLTLGGATNGGSPVTGQESWLQSGETITGSVEGTVTGGTLEAGPTLYATRTDEKTGYVHTTVYGIQASVDPGATQLSVSWRVTETNAGRLNQDFTMIMQVAEQ